MGNWIIHIEGVGPHHNGTDLDADSFADDCVQRLRHAGHDVRHAVFASGGLLVLPTQGEIREPPSVKASAQCSHQTHSGLDCVLSAGHEGPHNYSPLNGKGDAT